jgi:hypothetical protein
MPMDVEIIADQISRATGARRAGRPSTGQTCVSSPAAGCVSTVTSPPAAGPCSLRSPPHGRARRGANSRPRPRDRHKKVLVPGGSDAHYVPSSLGSQKRPDREGGYLVYVKGSTLMAIAFDPTRLATSGTPMMVLPRLATRPIGSGDFDVVDDGTLVYVDPPAGATTAAAGTLLWVDRQGHEKPLSASLPARPYGQPRVSPDGTQIAVAINDQENDIWVWDVARRTPLRKLTSGAATDFFPVWTIDSRRLIFGGGRSLLAGRQRHRHKGTPRRRAGQRKVAVRRYA